MEDDLYIQTNNDLQKKKKRRPRCAAGERNYHCGCGKAYLSYPALYTHVKNKHDGVFPIGSNAKRKIQRQPDDDTEALFIKDVPGFYKDFSEFLIQIEDASSKEKRNMSLEDINRIFSSLFPDETKEILLLKEAMCGMINLESDQDKFGKLKESLNINYVLAFYLISIFPYCSQTFFKEYFLLVFMIISSMNAKGKMFVKKQHKPMKITIQEQKLFCETDQVYVTSEILNLFLAELFPSFFKKFKEENKIDFYYLGFEDENIKNLILMSKFLANWLYNNGFINYRLEINVDF